MKTLADVLCGTLPETDRSFRQWRLVQANNDLYMVLTGICDPDENVEDVERAYSEVIATLGIKRIDRRAARRRTFALAVLGFAAALVALLLLPEHGSESTGVSTELSSTVACLSTETSGTVELKDDFIRRESHDMIITNDQSGTLVYERVVGSSAKESAKPITQILTVPKGGEYDLILSDGTHIKLNSMSQLVFPDRFVGNERVVSLMGEAYFEVAPGTSPFIVEVSGMRVEVRGTKFNVNTRACRETVQTTLVEGAVDVRIGEAEDVIELSPSQQLIYSLSSGSHVVKEVDVDRYTSWVNGKYVFRNQPLKDIFVQLEYWYGYKVVFEGTGIENMRFSGIAMKERDITYFLDQIRMVTDIRYQIEENIITLY